MIPLPGSSEFSETGMDEDLLPISALQHIAYCPRQFALIHIEQVWEENFFTADGRRLHERVDSGFAEQRKGRRHERSVLLLSKQHGLTGKMDLLEIEQGDPPRYFPVEYKRGKPKIQDWDRIQLCAQALCIEEMCSTVVEEGAIWYWEIRRREPITINKELRAATVATIAAAHNLRAAGLTPAPVNDKKRCRSCSLVGLCRPNDFRQDRSERYIEVLFQGEETP